MPLTLVVKEPFAGYEAGDFITDPIEIQMVRGTENALRVVQVSDEIVPPPPAEPQTSPLQAVLAEIALLRQRVAILEARPTGGGGTDPPPPGGQLLGAPLVDGDGTLIEDGDGTLLVR